MKELLIYFSQKLQKEYEKEKIVETETPSQDISNKGIIFSYP